MDLYNQFLISDINAPRVKHRALTGMLRKKWNRNPYKLARIIYNCDVSPYLGQLPPELRRSISREKIGAATAAFRENLENFLIKNAFDLREMECDRVYDIPELGDLFGTGCTLTARGVNVYGVNPWGGACGFVCKLSFPEINAHYALKLYHNGTSDLMNFSHGPWFESATAIAANYAEPRDNIPMYMASLRYDKYLLSAWAGDCVDGIVPRTRRNKIFTTTTDEDESRNHRSGRRIDWGETYRTDYGELSYRARKFFRQIMNMDERAVKKTIASARNNYARRDIKCALELADLTANYDDNEQLMLFIKNVSRVR